MKTTGKPWALAAWARPAWALVRLARPAGAGMVVAATLIGARLASVTLGSGASPGLLAAVMISNGLLFAGSMMVNDWRDVAEDRLNKPWRPVPSGAVGAGAALVGGAVAFTAAILLAALVSVAFAVLASVVTAASIAYSLRLKSVPLLGNALVAVLTAYPLWCWLALAEGPSAGSTLGPSYLSLLAGCVIFRLGAEVVKTGEDWEGDRASGIRTVATAHGVSSANRLGTALMTTGLLLAWIPVLMGQAGLLYGGLLSLATLTLGMAGGWALLGPGRGRREVSPRTSALLVSANRLTMALMVTASGLGLGRLR